MNSEAPKIVYRKNADGTMTKVLVKRVKKTIKLKSSPTTKRDQGGSSSARGDRPTKSYSQSRPSSPGRTSQAGRSSSPGRTSSSPGNRKDNRPSSAKGGRQGTSYDQRRSPKEGIGIPSKPGADGRKEKIFISKKKNERGQKGDQFYQKSQKKSFVEDKKNLKHNFPKLEDDLKKKEKRAVDEFAGVPKQIEIDRIISIKDLASKLNLKTSQVIKKLFNLGVVNLTVNDSIDAESAQIVCGEFGCEVKVVSLLDQTKIDIEKGDEKDYVPRPPIVTIMGHVDHGKTTLLDCIRKRKVATEEAGGITQHLGAYKIKTPVGEIVFIDTPGHSAFSSMRSRGARITDIVVIVVSATEGIMPQTIEAITHAKTAKCSIIVAINKIDLPEADVEKTKTMLAQHEISFEEWGGDVPVFPISALKNEGVDKLLEGIVALAKKKDLKGNPKIRAFGYVLESSVDAGRGITISIIVKNGTLKQGEFYICGKNTGRIRAMFDENGKTIKEATPSSIVEIIGLRQPISSGELFQVIEDEKESKRIVERRLKLEQQSQAAKVKTVTLSNLFAKIKESNIKEVRLIVKSDTFGSGEAIKTCLETLKNDEIKANIIHNSVGAVNENDVNLALTTQSEIIAFKVRSSGKVKKMAEEKNVTIKYYDVIYNIVEDIKEDLTQKLGDKVNEVQRALLEVKTVFKISGVGKVAGCEVLEGKVERKNTIRVVRDGRSIYTGEILSLKRFKDETKEVEAGKECGLSIKNFQDLKVGDRLEALEIQKIKKTLEIEES